MKVIIAGGRDFNDAVAVGRATVESGFDITEVVSGGAMGADAIGVAWAKAVGLPVIIFEAHWEREGRRAGPMRNRKMAEYADALIAMPGGRGTASMIAEAQRLNLKVFIAPLPAKEPESK